MLERKKHVMGDFILHKGGELLVEEEGGSCCVANANFLVGFIQRLAERLRPLRRPWWHQRSKGSSCHAKVA